MDELYHIKNKTIFVIWSGFNAMSQTRQECLESIMRLSKCHVCLVTPKNLKQFIVPDYPFHEAYQYLSETHKADYGRTYLMHHHGGGYMDIKSIDTSYEKYFDELMDNDNIWAVGYTEIGPQAVAELPGELGIELKNNWDKLIGNCAYIFRPNTHFTQEWYESLHSILDQKFTALKKYPAKFPQDAYGACFNRRVSQYPIRWTEILGDIFHPLCYKYRAHISYNLPPLIFENYR
jgi:hypothetical protein